MSSPSASLFPQLIPDRLQRALSDLQKRLWLPLDPAPVFTLAQTAPSAERRHPASYAAADFKPVPPFPYHWGKTFEFSSFRLTLTAPLPAGVYLHWRDQGEATLYHEGVPYWGLDSVHAHAPFPAGATEFLIESVCCRTGIWGAESGIDPEGSRHQGLSFVRRDDDVWHLWVDLRSASELLQAEHIRLDPKHEKPATGPRFHPAFDQMAPVNRRWFRTLDRALDLLDLNDLPGARALLTDLYAAHPQHLAASRAVLSGHAHIDLVWLWPERVGEFKATHTFATMTRLLADFPEFRFGYSQPASYEAVEKFSPALGQRVRSLIAEGRWEATGAAYVESDTQLACGEALARSFTLGQQGFIDLTGSPSKVLWLPDVFGYTACLPQLMRQAGVEFFFTTKLTWSLLNRFPYDSFRWRSPDGSEVVVHLSTGGNGYNGSANATEILNSAYTYRQADVHDSLLLPTGYGDGGGGVTFEMLERARRYRQVPQLPAVSWGRIDDFFETLRPVAAELPTYQGELYLEYHRGVQTTHSDLKAAFRALERALQTLEAAHALAALGPIDLTYWRRLVFAQFHDYIPGSSIPEVYAEHIPELQTLAARALAATTATLGSSSTSTNTLHGWLNPLPYPVRVRHEGRTLRLPPASALPTADLPSELSLPPLQRADLTLNNGRVHAAFATDGTLLQLIIDGTPLELAGSAARLALYEDTPSMFDRWDIDHHSLVHPQFVSTPVTSAPADADGEIGLAFTRPLGRASTVTTRWFLTPGDPVLRLTYELDWHEPRRLLKAHFPTRYLGPEALYGAPFGSIPRPQLPTGTAAEAMWEVPASRWAAVTHAQARTGLFLITEAKYGFSCRDGELTLSLVRSAESGDSHTDLGRHTLALALGRFAADAPREEQPFALADTLYTRPIPLPSIAAPRALPVAFSAGNTLHLSWIKPLAPGSCVLRFNEVLGQPGVLRLAPGQGITRIARVDLLDREQETYSPDAPIPYGPQSLLGLRVDYSA